MNMRLLSYGILFMSLSIIGCEKNNPENEVIPKQLSSSNLDSKCYWSPDGQYIAFLSSRNTYNPMYSAILNEIWIMEKDGTNQRPLFSFSDIYEWSDVANVSWSPDSHSLLAQIYVPGGSEIWKLSVDGNKTKMTSAEDWAKDPKYSPDGLKVAFIIRGTSLTDGSPVDRLYSANTDLTDTVLIEKGWIRDFDWTNDSEKLVYSLYDSTNVNSDLWKSTLDGSGKFRISETVLNERTVSCSLDGNYIAYSDSWGVYLTPYDNFNPTLLLDSARIPKWIPNREQILLFRLKTQGNMTWTESWIIDTNGDVILKIEEGSYSEVAFSSSGDYYTYTKDGNIWLDKLPL